MFWCWYFCSLSVAGRGRYGPFFLGSLPLTTTNGRPVRRSSGWTCSCALAYLWHLLQKPCLFTSVVMETLWFALYRPLEDCVCYLHWCIRARVEHILRIFGPYLWQSIYTLWYCYFYLSKKIWVLLPPLPTWILGFNILYTMYHQGYDSKTTQ